MIGDYICASDETEESIIDGLENGTVEFWRNDAAGREWYRKIRGTPKGGVLGVHLEDASEVIETEDGRTRYIFGGEADDDVLNMTDSELECDDDE